MVGRRRGAASGPTVVLLGGVHGNEPAGLRAIEAVLAGLEGLELRGEVLGVTGNRAALAEGRRYLRRDLNRQWIPQALGPLRSRPADALADEDREQRELLEVFEPILDAAEAPVVFLDMHTTSGPGAPFVCMADVLRNREVAFALPLPKVLGLEEVIEGSMLGYLCDLGHIGVAVEGGQHEEPEAALRLEAAAWLTLVAAGALDGAAVPELEAHRARLAEAGQGLPGVIEIRHRHVCLDDDGFVMLSGFRSFQPITKGQRLAFDARGDIHAPQGGLLMLPRYQGKGEDGFFVARPVRRFWLDLSARLRRARADRLLTRLPGVSPHPDRVGAYLVDPRIARVKVTDVFHLLGFRQIRPEGGMLAFSRRRPDDEGPAALPPPTR